MKKFLLLFLVIISTHKLPAQQITFERIIDTLKFSDATSVQQTLDGGYIIAGHSYSNNNDAMIIKLDKYGAIEWIKHYGGTGQDGILDIVQLPDSTYIGSGVWDAGLNGQNWIIKLDKYGDTLWTTHEYNYYSILHGGMCLGNNLDFINGGSAVFANTSSDAYVLSWDSLGKKNFIKNIPIPFSQSCYSITKLDTSGYYYTGQFGYNPNQGNACIVKINNQGDTIFTRQVFSPINNGVNVGFTIMPYLDTNLVVGGVQYNQPMVRYETLLVRANQWGDTLWTKLIIDTKDVAVSKLVQTKDQKIALIAARQDPLDLTKQIIWFLKCDENGDTLWTRMFKGIGSSKADNGLYSTSDSGFIICGRTSTSVTPARLYIIKTDSMGNVATSQTVNELSNTVAFSVFPNPSNGIFHLKLHILTKQADIEVYNSAGQIVYTDILNGNCATYELDLSDQIAGMYQIKISNNKIMATQKLILMK